MRLPARFRQRLDSRYWTIAGFVNGGPESLSIVDKIAEICAANDRGAFRRSVKLMERVEALEGASPIGLGASDEEICRLAETRAEEAQRIVHQCTHREALILSLRSISNVHRVTLPFGEDFTKSETDPETGEIKDNLVQAIARLVDPRWWRRQLRVQYGRAFEEVAIACGMVNFQHGQYCSDEALKRRMGQNKRNADALAATVATNENGQQFTLAELAELGVSNKAIRRGELMVRLKGFDDISMDLKHCAQMITVTCPSRMHSSIKLGKLATCKDNQKWDGTTPREAQQYLTKTWAKLRAALARAEIGIYGFRIAEPHHDGCPHWHMCLFCDAPNREKLNALVTKYFMQDSPDEQGAKEHRVSFELIDRKKGSAVSYVAKYISKNIDGYAVGNDLYGNPAMESSARVESWAAEWGIRQFQQVGGAPVGLWRELRRIEADTVQDAPDTVKQAHAAAHKSETQRADYAAFLRALGGPVLSRDEIVLRLSKRLEGCQGRYGYAEREKTKGVFHVSERDCVYASVRYAWTIKPGKKSSALRGAGVARTRLNNCTPVEPGRTVQERITRSEVDADGHYIGAFQRAQDWHDIEALTFH